jgi:hypothetical protein
MVSRHRRIAFGALVLVASSVPIRRCGATPRRRQPHHGRRCITAKHGDIARRTATTVRGGHHHGQDGRNNCGTRHHGGAHDGGDDRRQHDLTHDDCAGHHAECDGRSRQRHLGHATVNGVIVGLFVLAGLVALLTAWFYKRTPLPASLEVLEFMSRRKWRKAPTSERVAQLAALRTQIGDVPPENIVNLHPVPIERPVWRPSEAPDDSVADALVGLLPAPAVEANGEDATTDAAPAPAAEVPPAQTDERPADTLDPHG